MSSVASPWRMRDLMMLLFIAPPELRRIVAFAPSVISTLIDPAVASEELAGVMSNTAPAPTEMEDGLPKHAGLVAANVPPSMDIWPVNVFAPVSVNLPEPCFTRPAEPEITPE